MSDHLNCDYQLSILSPVAAPSSVSPLTVPVNAAHVVMQLKVKNLPDRNYPSITELDPVFSPSLGYRDQPRYYRWPPFILLDLPFASSLADPAIDGLIVNIPTIVDVKVRLINKPTKGEVWTYPDSLWSAQIEDETYPGFYRLMIRAPADLQDQGVGGLPFQYELTIEIGRICIAPTLGISNISISEYFTTIEGKTQIPIQKIAATGQIQGPMLIMVAADPNNAAADTLIIAENNEATIISNSTQPIEIQAIWNMFGTSEMKDATISWSDATPGSVSSSISSKLLLMGDGEYRYPLFDEATQPPLKLNNPSQTRLTITANHQEGKPAATLKVQITVKKE